MRFEYKYLINENQCNLLKTWCATHGSRDKYSFGEEFYDIENTYKIIWRDHDYKGKIRIRKYSHKNGYDYYLEEKKGLGAYNTKHRIAINMGEYDLLKHSTKQNFLGKINDLGIDVLSQVVSKYIPYNITVLYKRDAWLINYEENEYRFTFDNNLRLSMGKEKINLLGDRHFIFEIKGKGKPCNIIAYMNEVFNITPELISKYKLANTYLKL